MNWMASPGKLRLQGRPGDDLGEDAIGAVGVAAAAQDDGVAGLEAESGGVDGHVGPGLVHHRDDPERHPDPLDLQSLGRPPPGDDLPHRIGQGGDVAQAAGYAVAGVARRGEAVDERRGEALLAPLRDVLGVLHQDLGRAALERLGHRDEGPVLLGRGQQGQPP